MFDKTRHQYKSDYALLRILLEKRGFTAVQDIGYIMILTATSEVQTKYTQSNHVLAKAFISLSQTKRYQIAKLNAAQGKHK